MKDESGRERHAKETGPVGNSPAGGGRFGRRFPEPEPAMGPGAGTYAGLGLQFAVSILVFLYAGQWLDRRLGTAPWLLLLFVFGGAGASFYSIYRKLMAAQEREEQAIRERRAAEAARQPASSRQAPPDPDQP